MEPPTVRRRMDTSAMNFSHSHLRHFDRASSSMSRSELAGSGDRRIERWRGGGGGVGGFCRVLAAPSLYNMSLTLEVDVLARSEEPLLPPSDSSSRIRLVSRQLAARERSSSWRWPTAVTAKTFAAISMGTTAARRPRVKATRYGILRGGS